MKESIGGTQIFILVIALIIIFTAIMAFTINHSNAFAVKDQIVSIIESAGGFDMTAKNLEGSGIDNNEVIDQIVEALVSNSYRQIGRCPAAEGNNEVVGYQRNGAKATGDDKASFCIVKIPSTGEDGSVTKYYYQIIVFYSLDVPIINELFNFRAVGETKPLYS